MYNIYSLLESQAFMHPDSVSIVCKDESVTYQEFLQLVNRTAFALHEYGVGPGQHVAILFGNNIRFLSVFYALQKLGAVAVLLQYRCNISELIHVLDSSDSSFLIFDEELLETNISATTWKSSLTSISYAEPVRHHTPCLTAKMSIANNKWDYYADPEADAPALFVLSGGTTSAPKVIVSSQQALVYSALLHNVSDIRYGVYPEDTIALFLPLYHTGGLQYAITFLSVGGKIVLFEKYRESEILLAIQNHAVSHIFFIPANLCKKIDQNPNYQKSKVLSVRSIIMGGSVITSDIIDKAFSLFPNAVLTLGYGCSEGFNTAFCLSREEYEKNPSLALSVGFPQLMSQIRLLDENGKDVSVGTVGEAYGRSPWQMLGYYDDHRIHRCTGWIPSGDFMRMDTNGRFYFCDRKKDIVRTGGENVSTMDVENALMQHPAVGDCSVFGIPHPYFNEVIVAAVVKKEEVSEEELIQFCKTKIASYKKPRKIIFLDRIPHTSVGKPDKKYLKSVYGSLGATID